MDAHNKTPQLMNLEELADEIGQRLKAFSLSDDPAINPPRGNLNCTFSHTNVYRGGRYVMVRYMEPPRAYDRLTKGEAALYLQWLRAGNIGTHRDAPVNPEARHA